MNLSGWQKQQAVGMGLIYTLTPVSCVIVCNSKEEIMNPPLEGREAENMRSVCKSVQWGTRSGKKYVFTVQKCAMRYKEKKKYAFTVQKCAINLSDMKG